MCDPIGRFLAEPMPDYKYTSTLVECVTECPVEGFLPMQFKADSPRGESAIANMLKGTKNGLKFRAGFVRIFTSYWSIRGLVLCSAGLRQVCSVKPSES